MFKSNKTESKKTSKKAGNSRLSSLALSPFAGFVMGVLMTVAVWLAPMYMSEYQVVMVGAGSSILAAALYASAFFMWANAVAERPALDGKKQKRGFSQFLAAIIIALAGLLGGLVYIGDFYAGVIAMQGLLLIIGVFFMYLLTHSRQPSMRRRTTVSSESLLDEIIGETGQPVSSPEPIRSAPVGASAKRPVFFTKVDESQVEQNKGASWTENASQNDEDNKSESDAWSFDGDGGDEIPTVPRSSVTMNAYS